MNDDHGKTIGANLLADGKSVDFQGMGTMSKSKRKKPSAEFIAKRQQLISMSKLAKMMVAEGMAESVNEALLQMYDELDEGLEFNTFWQWKDKGYKVSKGSKAFLVWGKPKKVAVAEPTTSEEEEFKFWPVCYLFSETQVEKAAESVSV